MSKRDRYIFSNTSNKMGSMNRPLFRGRGRNFLSLSHEVVVYKSKESGRCGTAFLFQTRILMIVAV